MSPVHLKVCKIKSVVSQLGSVTVNGKTTTLTGQKPSAAQFRHSGHKSGLTWMKKKIIILSGSLLFGKLENDLILSREQEDFRSACAPRGRWHSGQEHGALESAQTSAALLKAVGFVLWGQGGGGWGQVSWPCWAFASSSVKQDYSLYFILVERIRWAEHSIGQGKYTHWASPVGITMANGDVAGSAHLPKPPHPKDISLLSLLLSPKGTLNPNSNLNVKFLAFSVERDPHSSFLYNWGVGNKPTISSQWGTVLKPWWKGHGDTILAFRETCSPAGLKERHPTSIKTPPVWMLWKMRSKPNNQVIGTKPCQYPASF